MLSAISGGVDLSGNLPKSNDQWQIVLAWWRSCRLATNSTWTPAALGRATEH